MLDGHSATVYAVTVATLPHLRGTANMEKLATHWAWMVNNSVCNTVTDATAADAQDAMTLLMRLKGADYCSAFGLGAKKWIDSEDREDLARLIQQTRKEKKGAA